MLTRKVVVSLLEETLHPYMHNTAKFHMELLIQVYKLKIFLNMYWP